MMEIMKVIIELVIKIMIFFDLNVFFLVKNLKIFKKFVLNIIGIFKKNENFVVMKCEVLIKIVFKMVVFECEVFGINVSIWKVLMIKVVL